jgi:nitric oxide reductase subunit B
MAQRMMPISSRWFQGAVVTYLIGFTVLGILAYLVYRDQPPLPAQVVAGDKTLFTRDDIIRGMNVFQRNGLMEYGSIYGHGAYLGPDFTAEYLHNSSEFLVKRYQGVAEGGLSARDRVAAELHANTYNQSEDKLRWSEARAMAHEMMVEHYQSVFQSAQSRGGAQANWIADRNDVRQLTAFFAWTAWTATANRPGKTYSYTSNWPPDRLAGNFVTGDAIVWSVISIISLLGGTGLVFYFFGRYDWLGWGDDESKRVRFRSVEDVALTPAQSAVVWFLLVSSLLFVLQTLTGGLIAHYRAEPGVFFGVDVSTILPFNIVRTWHVQLAIFWVSASYLATGIFIAPLIAGREPRGQSALTILLLIAVAIVVFGSLAGEYGGARGWLGDLWFWLGHQGWEYLDLGRLWQILLVIGLFLWVFILFRGLQGTLREEHSGNMPWLLFYAALAIPAFYAVGLLTSPDKGFVVNDFWRFWVVHLWVEDFLELFTTVIVAYMFVLLGVVREATALRVIYLDIILYSLGGVIGTMHHLYFSGTPVAHMALGATFSAMEVIPLMLLTLEAWSFIKSGEKQALERYHMHRWAVRFLIAVGVWNFFGAGVFGFLINLPVVSYYEIGTALTANHGHTAMMGVYGMLAAGLLLFCLRYLTRADKWSDRAAMISFWSLNIGLTWMAFFNLFPLGIVQLYHAVDIGYWHARSLDFLMLPWVNTLEWARLPGDALFILGGALPLVWLCWRAVRFPNPRRIAVETELPRLLFTDESESPGS